MSPLTERQIRASFVNCSKGEATRLAIPRDLAERPWDDLDYLGWRDPQSRTRGYLVAPYEDRLVGAVLRAPDATSAGRRNMCSLCMTVQSGGVALLVAPRAGKPGKQGDSVGTYICSNLSCSLHIRGKLATEGVGMHETLSVEERAERLVTNLHAFVRRIL